MGLEVQWRSNQDETSLLVKFSDFLQGVISNKKNDLYKRCLALSEEPDVAVFQGNLEVNLNVSNGIPYLGRRQSKRREILRTETLFCRELRLSLEVGPGSN